MPLIAVFGANRCSGDVSDLAEEVGRELARAGAILVCGGTTGVMEAACRGAKEAGGLTVGILPGETRGQANRYVDIPIVTGLGEARNVIIARTCQAAIAVSGGLGTLSEIAFALKFGRTVVGLSTWALHRAADPHAAACGLLERFLRAETPAEAVGKALRAAQVGREKQDPLSAGEDHSARGRAWP